MRITIEHTGLTLIRELGDKPVYRESTITYHIMRLLRAHTGKRFVRINPSNEGMTACSQGVIDRESGECFWHANYAIESACQAFNSGSVFYHRA